MAPRVKFTLRLSNYMIVDRIVGPGLEIKILFNPAKPHFPGLMDRTCSA